MGGVIRGARRVPADAVQAHGEAARVRDDARGEAARIVAAARAEATRLREDARNAGRAEALAACTGRFAAALDRRLGELRAAEPEILSLALEIARRVVRDCHAIDPELVARRAAVVIQERFQGPVTARCAPADAGRLEAALRHPAGGRAVTVVADPALPPGRCRLEADGAEVELDDERILDTIARRLAPAERTGSGR